jgi:hypothetical protein
LEIKSTSLGVAWKMNDYKAQMLEHTHRQNCDLKKKITISLRAKNKRIRDLEWGCVQNQQPLYMAVTDVATVNIGKS